MNTQHTTVTLFLKLLTSGVLGAILINFGAPLLPPISKQSLLVDVVSAAELLTDLSITEKH